MPEINVTSVRVRMYRHGFGDCFLLSYFTEADRVFTMLIDCGIKYNTKSDEVPVEDVIQDLRNELTPDGQDNPKLDVLVATHEHWDHISFFHPTHFDDFFADFDIDQIWLAWTENPKDKEAKEINSRLRDGAAALQFAATKLHNIDETERELAGDLAFRDEVSAARKHMTQSLDDIMGFYGVTAAKEVSESGIKYKKNGRISSLTEQAMERIIALSKDGKNIRYFNPGETVDSAFLPPGINVYVLGPPRSSLINKSNPSRGAKHETYLNLDRNGFAGFMEANLSMAAKEFEDDIIDSCAPFGPEVGLNRSDLETQDRDQKPNASIDFLRDTYFGDQEKYRTIHHTWLDAAGQFALQLDGAINNTSLVLAIEIADSGKVLLFPGDAQVGSWLSWHDHEWEVPDDASGQTVDITDLFKRTVLYKVSHHGSHNATIKDKGLELMTSPELVAMIPEKEDSYNGILYDELMTRLNELCKGRVIVSADKGHPPENLLDVRPSSLSAAQWEHFKDRLSVVEQYVEITVE